MKMVFRLIVVYIVCQWFGQSVVAYKPVVIIHGLIGSSVRLDYMADRIREKHPGTEVFNLNLFPHLYSLRNMWTQIDGFRQNIEKILIKLPPSKFHLIGYSQGGLIARGVIQSWPNHTVSNFISLSSPQAGQFGDGFLHVIYPTLVRKEAYRLFYTRYGQTISVANYWNDPQHSELFLQWSDFLARINNLVLTANSTQFRETMEKLERVVLIGGPDDGVIAPWQSAQFGFYDRNMSVVPLKQQRQYKNNLIGLRSLDCRGALVTKTFPNVTHHFWHHTEEVIDKAILPFLD